jgi:hypothetical protein
MKEQPTPEPSPDLRAAARALALIASQSAEARQRRADFDGVETSDPNYQQAQQSRHDADIADARLDGALIVLETLSPPSGVESWRNVAGSAEAEIVETGGFLDLGNPDPPGEVS